MIAATLSLVLVVVLYYFMIKVDPNLRITKVSLNSGPFNHHPRLALLHGDLGNAMVVSVCVDAVATLHEKKTAVLSPGLREMTALKNAIKVVIVFNLYLGFQFSNHY